jgi:Ca-activated chloride channel family protein
VRVAYSLVAALLAGPVAAVGASQAAPAPQTTPPTFRTGVSRVAVAATVRDRKGRPVANLKAEDFELVDSGVSRKIAEFRSETTDVSLAMLVDDSGSMVIGQKREVAKAVAEHLVQWLTPEVDRVALYTFHQYLEELQPLGPAPGRLSEKFGRLQSYGKTGLYDAIAEAGKVLSHQGGPRRALVVLTDGADNASRLTPGEVSGMASAIDVPVYVVVVVSPDDLVDRETPRGKEVAAMLEGRLGDLARWTGGEIFAAINPASMSLAARRIVEDLRHQYLITFEPSREPGWHPIDLRARDKGLVVRARSGYIIQSSPSRPFVF